MKINIAKVVGKGYGEYWRTKKRYVVVKGGRGSKKSKTTALWIIYNMMKYPLANTLVVRQVYKDNRDSTLKDLEWASYVLGVHDLWKFNINPIEVTFIPTGQKILFRGLNDAMSLTSIAVSHGYLCWCWIEEAYQIKSEDDFNKLDMSIRGQLPDGYFKRIMITFNPWNERHWLKRRFFDVKSPDILALTTNYMCNEFLGKDDLKIFEEMKEKYPRRYKVEGLGNWGISEGVVFDNWTVKQFDYTAIHGDLLVGLDFGFIADPTALIASILDEPNKRIYIFSESFRKGLLNNQIAELIRKKGFGKSTIIADSAEQKSIEEIRRLGISRIRPAKKGQGSILQGIQKLQQYEIIINPVCTDIIDEFSNYCWKKDKNTNVIINEPVDEYNHGIDALRYSLQCIGGSIKTMNKSILGL